MQEPGVYPRLAKQKSPEEAGELEEDWGPEDATDGIYFWNSSLRSKLPKNTTQLQTQPAPSCLEVQPVHTHLSRAAPAGPTTSMTQHLPGSAPARPSTLYDLAPLGSTSLQTSTYQDSVLEGPSIFREYQTIICQ